MFDGYSRIPGVTTGGSDGARMPKVSEAHREQVRQRLVDAAGRVVRRDGHERATTRAILAEAGLSAGALYTYFASKEELFEAVAEQVIGDNIVLFAAEGEPGEHAGELLDRFVTALLAQPDESPALTWFRGRMTSDPEVCDAIARFNRWMVGRFTPLVEQAQAEGRVRPDVDAEAIVELFDLIVDGMHRRHVTGTFVTDFDRVGAAALSLLDRGAR
jgi:AcrR family transcriptional regulator